MKDLPKFRRAAVVGVGIVAVIQFVTWLGGMTHRFVENTAGLAISEPLDVIATYDSGDGFARLVAVGSSTEVEHWAAANGFERSIVRTKLIRRGCTPHRSWAAVADVEQGRIEFEVHYPDWAGRVHGCDAIPALHLGLVKLSPF